MFRKFARSRVPELAADGPDPELAAPLRSPLTELALGVAMTGLALAIAWGLIRVAADTPADDAAPSDSATLSEEWRWGTGDYRFDHIYGPTETPAAYRFDFVYPRPAVGPAVR
jgi:hypothetical protein